MNANEIESAIEHAINALALAKLALSKSALPIFSDSDDLRKVAVTESTADPVALLADAERRLDILEAQRAKELEQAETSKTHTTRFDS